MSNYIVVFDFVKRILTVLTFPPPFGNHQNGLFVNCKEQQGNLMHLFRFASFVEGNSHLSDEEILEYETSIHETDLTDDEEEMSEED